MILQGSRYELGEVVRPRESDGTARLFVYANPTGPRVLSVVYRTTKVGDRWDRLANAVMRDPKYWWVIADLNPELADVVELPAGVSIRIPVRWT